MAKKKGISADELRSSYEPQVKLAERLVELGKIEMNDLNGIFNTKQKLIKSQEILNLEQSKLNQMSKSLNQLTKKGVRITEGKQKIFNKEYETHLKSYKLAEKDLKTQQKKVVMIQQYTKAGEEMVGLMAKAGSSLLKYLVESDVAIKNLNLGLGLSGDRSAQMAENLSAAAPFAARMGVGMKDLALMASEYADETGRARILNQQSLESMSLIAEGTNLGAEGAARMAGQYEMMGFSATDTAGEVQRIVDVTERMGVNTGKVLKAVGSNFKKLQKYSFKNGVKGMADMAIYASKFKMDMNEIFAPLESGRHLDSVVEMSAKLQVLGGNFSNLADPMSMLFESRNDPKAYLKRINEMTKGMVTLNKTADGFEFEMASPMAQDQLAAAAKALGMTTEELTQQAFRMAEIQKTRSQMFSKGFTSSEKEVIEGLAKFDKKSGKMIVEIGTTAKEIANLTSQDIKALDKQRSSLEARAEAAQGFDEAFKNIVLELKASFLPLLKSMNEGLKFVRPFVSSMLEMFHDGNGWVKAGMGLAALLTVVAAKLTFAFGKGLALNNIPFLNNSSGGGGGGDTTSTISKSAGKGAKAAGKGAMMKGLGVGGAALGIGAGIGLAAVGIGQLAESMQKLDVEKMVHFEIVALGLAIAIPAMTVGILALGTTSAMAAPGLLTFGGTVALIGAGIGMAAAGIGYMVGNLAKLDGVDLSGAATGLLALGGAALMVGNPFGLAGLAAMTASAVLLSYYADDLKEVGSAFAMIGAVMNGSSGNMSGIKDTINAINDTDLDIGGVAALASVLSNPIKVEFANKEISMVANIDVTMDGERLTKIISQRIPATLKGLQQAKEGV